jgi:hypothetical protein
VLFVYCWSCEHNIGKKGVLTNALTLVPKTVTGGRKTYSIPAYDQYKLIFSSCDIFNRNLKDRPWPVKYGGRGMPAEPRNEQNFAFSSLLQNVFGLYLLMLLLLLVVIESMTIRMSFFIQAFALD